MTRAELQDKVNAVSQLLRQPLEIKAWGRKYRVEVNETGLFTKAWLPPQDLYNRLDFAQTALEIARKQEQPA